ncbi:MAG: nicotinamide mononucleotide transporter, partial [Abditibacteriota bacterium]|nr:nicotinamide mononucleotide transporter [Abditibacteriota bacterium]
MKEFIKEELSGWRKWEVAWLLFACAAIAALSIYWHDTLMGIISATTGVACVVCTGKGKLSAYIFGTINVILYAIISCHARYYGEVMLN